MARENVVDLADLRDQAARKLGHRHSLALDAQAAANSSSWDLTRALYELDLHRVELELQHEELQSIRERHSQSAPALAPLFEHADLAYLRLDGEDLVRRANPAAVALLAAPNTDIVGTAASRFIASTSHSAFLEHRRAVRETGRVQTCDLMLENASKRLVRARAITAPSPRAAASLGLELLLIELGPSPAGSTDSRTVADLTEQHAVELEQKSIAIAALADEVVAAQNRMRRTLLLNIEQAVLPVLDTLRARLGNAERATVDYLSVVLRESASTLALDLDGSSAALTPRELQIAHMVRSGLCTKEIAAVLGLSPQSVDVHRKSLRKKLGLTGSKTNLAASLRAGDVSDDPTAPPRG